MRVAVARSTSSWMTTSVGAVGHRRAGEDADRLARADACRRSGAPAARVADDARGGAPGAASAARTA